MDRSLRLRRETLAELTREELAAVATGDQVATVSACIGPVLSLTLCGPSRCQTC